MFVVTVAKKDNASVITTGNAKKKVFFVFKKFLDTMITPMSSKQWWFE